MKIKGKHGEYRVLYGQSGYSFESAFVYVRKWWGWKNVYKSVDTIRKGSGRKMYPEQMRRWFQSAVDRYERYEEEWGRLPK